MRNIDPSLGKIVENVSVPEEGQPSWIRTLSHGSLTEPSEQWLSFVKEFEKVFIELHGPLFKFSTEFGVVKVLKERLSAQFPNVCKEAVHVYSRIRTFIRVREVNRQHSNSKRKQTKKATKWTKSNK